MTSTQYENMNVQLHGPIQSKNPCSSSYTLLADFLKKLNLAHWKRIYLFFVRFFKFWNFFMKTGIILGS